MLRPASNTIMRWRRSPKTQNTTSSSGTLSTTHCARKTASARIGMDAPALALMARNRL